MSAATKIEWTDKTWNPWQGCHKVSEGCRFCYMFRDKKRYGQDPNTVRRSAPATFNAPLKWNDPARVFTCSWSDWFVEEADPWRAEAWDIIRRTPHLTYQILTKRPGRILGHLPADWGDGWRNCWLGVSVENQAAADERIPHLLRTPAAVRFLSAEPLLGEVDLWRVPGAVRCCGTHTSAHEAQPHELCEVYSEIGWLIVGCESGPKRRPMDAAWAKSLREQCEAAGVPFFLKQMVAFGRVSGDPEEWPEWARVREFPGAEVSP